MTDDAFKITVPVRATQVGQRVRFTGYGGNVRTYHSGMTGTVVRFTRAGNPVVRLDHAPAANPKLEITDTERVGVVLDADGKLLREEMVQRNPHS